VTWDEAALEAELALAAATLEADETLAAATLEAEEALDLAALEAEEMLSAAEDLADAEAAVRARRGMSCLSCIVGVCQGM